MAQLELLKVDKWTPPIRTKMMSSPVISLNVAIADPDKDLNEMVTKQRAIFDKEWKANQKKFATDVTKLGAQKVKAVQDAVTWTEEQIAKKKTKNEQTEVIGTANKMLEQAWKVYEYELQKLGQQYFEDAVEKSYKAMKLKVIKAQAKAIAKIVVVVALALTAAGLAIAATVLTGGAAAPIAIAAVLGGFKVVYATYKAVDSNWMNASKQISIVQKDVDTLKAAAGKLQGMRALDSAGPGGLTDPAKKLMAAVSGKMVDLEKHVGQLDKFIVATSMQVKKQSDELNKINDDVNKTGDADAKKKALELQRSLMGAIGTLRAIDDVRVAAAEVKTQWDKEQKLNPSRLDPALKKLGDAAPFLMQIKDGVSNLATPIKNFAKALG